MFYCLNLGFSSPITTAILAYLHNGYLNPTAEPKLGFGY